MKGAEFINEIYHGLHTEFIVENTNKYNLSRTPSEKINDYIKRLEKIHDLASEDERLFKKLKGSYHKNYIMKKEWFPDSYFEKQSDIAFKKGLGKIEFTDEKIYK